MRCAAWSPAPGPTCVFLCESDGARRARSPAALRGAGHDAVLTAHGPVAGAHVAGDGGLMANLVNLERVSKAYGVRPLLDEVSPRHRARASGSASSAATATARPRCSR